MAETFNLNQVIQQSSSWVKSSNTAREIGEQAMAEREMERAQEAVSQQRGFLELTLREKIEELKIPDRVRQEITDVAIKTLKEPLQPFLDWLEANEVYYTESMFEEAISRDAKNLFYTNFHLTHEATKNGVAGLKFTMAM